jgi:hypothetical protein
MTTTPEKLSPFEAETLRLRLLAAEAQKMADECCRPQPSHPLPVLESMGLSVTSFRRLVEELTGTVQVPDKPAEMRPRMPLDQLADENRQLATLALNIAHHTPDNTDRATTARLWNAFEPLALRLSLANRALYEDRAKGHWSAVAIPSDPTQAELY